MNVELNVLYAQTYVGFNSDVIILIGYFVFILMFIVKLVKRLQKYTLNIHSADDMTDISQQQL